MTTLRRQAHSSGGITSRWPLLFLVFCATGVVRVCSDEPTVDYEKFALSGTKDAAGRYIGPGALLIELENPSWLPGSLSAFKVATSHDALTLAIGGYSNTTSNDLHPSDTVTVTDLRIWKDQHHKTMFAWCVSVLQVRDESSYSRLRNRIWIDAASGALIAMRKEVEARKPAAIALADGNLLPILAGDKASLSDLKSFSLLPILAGNKATRSDLQSQLATSKVPLPESVLGWERLRMQEPLPNAEHRAVVHMLVELAGDDSELGKDGDLIWIVHKEGGQYEFSGERWVNSRTGKIVEFSTDAWE